jgi:putative DNA primase/helicase
MDFRKAMTSTGLIPRDIVADGRWYRCATSDKPRKRNGCYMLRTCGTRGYFKNYATDADWNEWRADKPLTLAQRKQADRDLEEARQREIARRFQAVKDMRAYWDSLKALREYHPYIENKGLSMMGCSGLRVDGDLLVIPAMQNGKLMTLQTITPEGEKKYRAGCSIKGSTYRLDRKSSSLTCLVEGFATGLAIFQSVPQASVIVCFDASNLVHVASEINVRGMTVVCADNDWETEKRTGINTGIQKGRAAADALKCGVAYPSGIEGSDWADALLEWGSQGVHKIRMEIMRNARPVFA